jgi:replicative DNA helicase
MTDYSEYRPSDKLTERALLGSLLLAPYMINSIDIQPDDFFFVYHRDHFAVMRELGEDANIVSILSKMNGTGDAALLSGCMNEAISPLYADNYVKIIKEKATERRGVLLAEQMVQDIQHGTFDPGKYITALSNNVNVDGGAEHIRKYSTELEQYAMEREKDPREVWGIPTGITLFDKLTGGLHRRKMVIISGDPGLGKTIFVVQAAVAAAQAGHRTVVYELELTGRDMASRIISGWRGVSERDIHRGKLGTSGMLSLGKGVQDLNELPIYISEATQWTATAIRADVARLKANGGVDLVVLDSLARLKDSDSPNNWENDTLKADRIRDMAKDLDVALLTVHNKVKTEGTPRMRDLRGGYDIPYQTDELFFMVESDLEMDWGKPRRLIPSKQRYGGPVSYIDLAIPNDRPILVEVGGEDEH